MFLSFLYLFLVISNLCASQIEASTPPPPPSDNPRAFEFLEIFFVQIPRSPGRKAVQMPPPPGRLPDYCFNFSVAFIIY